ncbi:hypothetical protein K6L09_20690 [Burkholderia cepacia]
MIEVMGYTIEELNTAYEAILNDIGIEASFSDIKEILTILESEYYDGESLDILKEYITPEFLIKVAEEIFVECERDNKIISENDVVYNVINDLKTDYDYKQNYDHGYINIDEDGIIDNEINNGEGFQVGSEYFYGNVEWQVGHLAKEWDAKDYEEKYNFLLDFATDDIDGYVSNNIEELQERYGDDFDWEEASDETKLEILLESDLLEVKLDDIYDEISNTENIDEENKYYITEAMGYMLIGQQEMIERCKDAFFQACDAEDSYALSLIDWNEERVFEHATDTDELGESHYHFKIGEAKYLRAVDVAWGNERDETISKVFLEMHPEFSKKVASDYVFKNRDEFETIKDAVNMEKSLPQKTTKAQKLSDDIEAEDFTYKPAATKTTRTKL